MGVRRVVKKFLKYLAPTLVVLLIIPFSGRYQSRKAIDSFRDGPLRCALALGEFDKLSKGYLTGFNYELLKQFGSIHCDSIEIFLGEASASYMDSLLVDSLDILVIPGQAADDQEGLSAIFPIDTSVAWVIKKNPYKGREIIHWANSLKNSEDYPKIVARFFDGYNPYRNTRKNPSIISPYDALFKKNAKIIGWDWKLLAALAWNESMFRIQARSPKGALGLMQMMPRTAGRYGVEDVLDPEKNIEAGARYLVRLKNIFSAYTTDPDMLTSLTIAAYNCGEGRALEDLEGRERSSETSAYVKGVLNLYDFFSGVEPRFKDVVDSLTVNLPDSLLGENVLGETGKVILLGPDSLGRVDSGNEQAGDEEKDHDDQE